MRDGSIYIGNPKHLSERQDKITQHDITQDKRRQHGSSLFTSIRAQMNKYGVDFMSRNILKNMTSVQ